MSQLILRLRNDLARATLADQRIELNAKLAMQLARIGSLEEARKKIEQARKHFVDGHGGIGTVWVMLAEALVFFFEQQHTKAQLRMNAAHALAVSIGQSKLIASTSAWKAHLQFENSEFQAMVDSLRIAFAHALTDDFDSQTRAAIVLFNSFSTSGEIDKAQIWFARAHGFAIKNGDRASLDALLFNRAALVLGHLRVKQCAGILEEVEVSRVRLEFMSSQNLTLLTGISALANLVPLINSKLLLLEGNFDKAIHLLTQVRGGTLPSSKNFSRSYVDLELCFCHFKIKEFNKVEKFLGSVQLGEFNSLDIDENIVSIWMRLQMAETYPHFGSVDELRNRLKGLCSSYFESRAALVASLDVFSVI